MSWKPGQRWHLGHPSIVGVIMVADSDPVTASGSVPKPAPTPRPTRPSPRYARRTLPKEEFKACVFGGVERAAEDAETPEKPEHLKATTRKEIRKMGTGVALTPAANPPANRFIDFAESASSRSFDGDLMKFVKGDFIVSRRPDTRTGRHEARRGDGHARALLAEVVWRPPLRPPPRVERAAVPRRIGRQRPGDLGGRPGYWPDQGPVAENGRTRLRLRRSTPTTATRFSPSRPRRVEGLTH